MPQDYLGLPSVGCGWKESLTIARGVRSEIVGILGRWLVWRYFRTCFDSRRGGFVGLPRFTPAGQGLVCPVFFAFLPGLYRRCPDAGLGFGVRLVVLWVSGHTADTADPLVVPAPSSYFLRLIPNRLSTERKRFGLDAVPTPGWVKGFLLFPQLAVRLIPLWVGVIEFCTPYPF